MREKKTENGEREKERENQINYLIISENFIIFHLIISKILHHSDSEKNEISIIIEFLMIRYILEEIRKYQIPHIICSQRNELI